MRTGGGAADLPAEPVRRREERGSSDVDADEIMSDVGIPVIPFDEALAVAAGRLRAPSRHVVRRPRVPRARADLGATVLTADRAWADLDLGVTNEVIR